MGYIIKKIKGVKASIWLLTALILLSTLAAGALLRDDIALPFLSVLCGIGIAAQSLSRVLAALIIIAAAAMWVYSRDDAGKRNAAKVWILHALVGLVIIIIALNIIRAVTVGGSSVPISCP